MIESHEIFVGMLCAWRHVPRGGYGLSVMIPARVECLSLDGTRVVIAVQTRSGSTVRRTVSIHSLAMRKGEP